MTSTVNVAEAELRRRLKRRVDLFGLTAVARELEVGREALARYGADYDLHAGTRALIEARLAELDDSPEDLERELRERSRAKPAAERKERARCSS